MTNVQIHLLNFSRNFRIPSYISQIDSLKKNDDESNEFTIQAIVDIPEQTIRFITKALK